MGVFKKLIFIVALVISVVSGITLSSTPVEARWVFDASPPTSVITHPTSTGTTTSLTATITDNSTLNPLNKEFFFLISSSVISGGPAPLSSYPRNCPSYPSIITAQSTPCLISVLGQPGIISGGTNSLIARTSNNDFSANTPTYYIYGKLLQDEVGNSGLWSAPETFTPTPPPADPFLQTTEGDVHSNENIDTQKKP